LKVLWPPPGPWIPLALSWSPPGLKTNKKLAFDTFRFVQLHKSRSIGPSETNGKQPKTIGKHSENYDFPIFSDFPILRMFWISAFFEQKGNSNMAIRWP